MTGILEKIDVPTVDAVIAEFVTVLSKHQEPVVLDLEEDPIEFRYLSCAEMSCPTLQFPVSSELGSFLLHIDPALFAVLSDKLLPKWRAEDQNCLPDLWRAITVFYCLISLTPFDNLDWECGEISGSNTPFTPSRACQSFLEVKWRGRGYPIAIQHVSHPNVKLLQSLLPEPESKSLLSAKIDLQTMISLPALSLPVEQARQLKPGDVLLPPNMNTSSISSKVIIEGLPAYDGQISLDGSFIPSAPVNLE